MATRFASLFGWALVVWILLTWTWTAEQVLVGVGIALGSAAAMAPLGEVVAPWRLFAPRRAAGLAGLASVASGLIIGANLRLLRRIWTPHLPLRSGMVVISTEASTDGELAAVGLISSLIVESQIVDLDRGSGRLQYHVLDVPTGSGDRARITRPIERFLPSLTRRDRGGGDG